MSKKSKPDARPQGKSLHSVLAKMVKPAQLGSSLRPKDYGLSVSRVGNVSLSDQAQVQEELIQDATEEQRAVAEASRDAAQLMAENEALRRLSGAMIAFRQCYAVAYRELQSLLEKEENLHPLTEDVIIGAAMYEASKPFDENRLMRGIADVVLPWLADVVDRHIETEQSESLKARVAAEESRRNRPVPIGFKHTQEQESPVLSRERPLVLVGWSKALLWLLDQITNSVLVSNKDQLYSVIRFMENAPKAADQHRQLIRLGKSAWAGCADSANALARCVGTYVAEKLSQPPDLLIVENLAACYTRGFTGRPDAASAGDANKTLSRWCSQAGAALIGCVPLDSPDDDVAISGGEFEQLRTFTSLRAVHVTDADTCYRITVGNYAAIFDVPKTTIDGYGTGSIVVPSGVV